MINKNISLASIVVVSVVLIEIFNNTQPRHPHAGLTIEQLVTKYGYPIETHEVTTDDDYILTINRIPHGPRQSPSKRTPVLFMHGFTQSAADFINMGPNQALSFLLVDQGYDVWLGNARGTTWSRKHKFLNASTDKEFWDYSMDEIGYYDVPAFIDHILKVTGEDSLHYVGYSQGTVVFFILGSEKPEYMRRIKLMTALAPAIFMEDPIGPLRFIVQLRKLGQWLSKQFNIFDILSEDSYISTYMRLICNEHSLFVDLCLHHMFLLHGYSYDQTNKTILSLIYSNTPAGASPKQVLHVAQFMQSSIFCRYDLGKTENLKKYGQEHAPLYDVSQINTPIALYYASNDWAINIKNIEKTIRNLPNVVKSYKVPSETFNHNDFIYAKDVVDLLYEEVVNEILKY